MTIDGKDIKKEYGCTLLKGSFDSLLKYPKRKPVPYRDWAELDGIVPDLSEVNFEPRSISLTFLQEAKGLAEFTDLYNKLYSQMSVNGYRTIDAIPGMTTKVRLNSTSGYKIPKPFNAGKNLTKFTLHFIEDSPVVGKANSFRGNNAPSGLYQINGNDFGLYGIGADEKQDNIIQYPSIKEPFSDGKNVHLEELKTAHKEIQMPLWMLADSIPEFLNNYRAFFTQLTKPGEQYLYLDQLGITTGVYYSDCTNFKVESWGNGKVAVRFTISLVIPVVTWVDMGGIRRYRILRDTGTNSVLADEQKRIIIIK